MIKGAHAMFYTSDPEATRAFFRDKLKVPYTDVGQGWLVFKIPEAEVGFHGLAKPNGGSMPDRVWEISLYCDDIAATVADLKTRGVEFSGDVQNHGYGLVTLIKAPGGLTVQLYQPLYK